jgi:hypothetical protein
MFHNTSIRMTTRQYVPIFEPPIFVNLTIVPVCGGRYLCQFWVLLKTTIVQNLHQEDYYTLANRKNVQN